MLINWNILLCYTRQEAEEENQESEEIFQEMMTRLVTKEYLELISKYGGVALHNATVTKHFVLLCYAMVCFTKHVVMLCGDSQAVSWKALCETNCCVERGLCSTFC